MSGLNPERWGQLWRVAAKKIPPVRYFQNLVVMYSESQRHYHTQRHIVDCLAEFDRNKAFAVNPTAIELAIWFHDAIYDPRAGDNEERSAKLAALWLGEFCAEAALIDVVGHLVLATKHHDGSVDVDAPLLVDIDLSILGQPAERFWEYERQVRKEYSWVDKALFCSKRAEILANFLSRPRLYQTDHYFQQLEAPARENLAASIERLKSGRLD